MVDEPIKPGFELTPEMKKQLDDLETPLAQARRTMDVLKEMDLNIQQLEDMYDTAINMRNVLLKNFT